MPTQTLIDDLCERFEQPVSVQPLEFLVIVGDDGYILGQLKKTPDGKFALTVDGEFRGILGG